MSTLEVNQISPSTGTTVTIGGSGDTVTLGSGATQSGFGGAMSPAFHLNKTSSQDIPDNAWTKITFDTELFDTDNCVSSNRFTPTTAGKYFIYATLTVGSVSTVTNLRSSYTAIYKNGSLYTFSDNNWNGSFIFAATHHVGAIIDFNGSTDYVEVYGNGDLTTGNPRIHSSSNVQCYFGGYKIIE